MEKASSSFFLILLAEKEVNELMEELFETVSDKLKNGAVRRDMASGGVAQCWVCARASAAAGSFLGLGRKVCRDFLE